MTEKRFTESIYGIRDNQTNIQYGWREADLGIIKLCELLNSLNNENEQLKKDATTLIYANQDYRKENEQLKQSLKNKMESDAYWEQKATERVNKLEKENEELKKDLEILVHLFDWRAKLEKEWWRCEYFTSPLGVAFCSKNEDFCKRSECEEIYKKIGELNDD